MKNAKRYIIAAMGLLGVMLPAAAQSYFDDLYDSPPPKATKVNTPKTTVVVADYAPADSYVPSGSLQMDVDTYNRRGQFLVSDSVGADTLGNSDTFAYTRRIERFHNPEVVTESGDTTLCDYYYTAPQDITLNINVIDNTPYYPYSWAWRYGSPWYWNVYGPSYIGWGSWYDPWYWGWYDPWPTWGWSWGWTWAPGWGGWGPGWGGWGPGWAGPGMAWRPSSPGASVPHRPTGAGASAGRGHSGNQFAGANTGRPGNMGRPSAGSFNTGNIGTAARPGASGSAAVEARPGTRPSASQGTYTPYGAGTRGRNSQGVNNNSGSNNYRPSNSYQQQYNNNRNNNYNNDRNSYNNSNRNSYNSNRGSSYGGGSNSTRGGGYSGGGGGSHSSGGGGRGRR